MPRLNPILVFLVASSAACGATAGRGAPPASASAAAKIADAMSAAPPLIARHAAVVDRPATPGASPALLREGSNGWTCTPSRALGDTTARPTPSCLNAHARAWFAARAAGEVPRIQGIGLVYRLMGDDGASNRDPSAAGPTADNEWVVTGPHVILFLPDVADLAGLPSDPATGGPFVMWRDTPYAHIMMPVSRVAPTVHRSPRDEEGR